MKRAEFILIILVLTLSACKKSTDPTIYGKWQLAAIGLPVAQGVEWHDQHNGFSPYIIQFSSDHSYFIFEDIVPFSYKGSFDVDISLGLLHLRHREAPNGLTSLPNETQTILSLTTDLLWVRDGSGNEFKYFRQP